MTEHPAVAGVRNVHATASDTIPDGDGQRGTARSWCTACPWVHELCWNGPAHPYEANALMLTQAHATAHERAASG